jgi:hypothetical protein
VSGSSNCQQLGAVRYIAYAFAGDRGEVTIHLSSYPLVHLTTAATAGKSLADYRLRSTSGWWWNWWTRKVASVLRRVKPVGVRVGAPLQREFHSEHPSGRSVRLERRASTPSVVSTRETGGSQRQWRR